MSAWSTVILVLVLLVTSRWSRVTSISVLVDIFAMLNEICVEELGIGIEECLQTLNFCSVWSSIYTKRASVPLKKSILTTLINYKRLMLEVGQICTSTNFLCTPLFTWFHETLSCGGQVLERCIEVYAVCVVCETAIKTIDYYWYIDQVCVACPTSTDIFPRSSNLGTEAA